MTVYAQPGQQGAKVEFKARYENWIGGKWVPPTKGQYFENVTPITGKQFTEAAKGTPEDIELALDAAHAAAPAWGKTSPAERALILHRIGDQVTCVWIPMTRKHIPPRCCCRPLRGGGRAAWCNVNATLRGLPSADEDKDVPSAEGDSA